MNNESIIIRSANINDIDNNLLNIFIDGFEFHLNGRKDIFDNMKNDDLKKDLINLIENKDVLVAEKNNNILIRGLSLEELNEVLR